MKLNIAENAWPPGGWQYFDPKTGYRESKPMEKNRREAATAIMQMRRNNRHVYKTHEATFEAALSAIETYTAQRLANQGLTQFILPDNLAAAAPSIPPTVKKKLLIAGAKLADAKLAVNKHRWNWLDKIRKIARGAATLVDWVGTGQKPVPPVIAERRASICAVCPLNKEGSIVTGVLAEAIKEQTALKHHLDLKTSVDDKLLTCEACSCHLPLKVWVPIKTILNHTPASVRDALHEKCWIKSESPTHTPPTFTITNSSKQRIPDISIRRRGAIGDVIMATAVARKVATVAQRVTFQTVGGCQELISNLPYIHSIVISGFPNSEIDLDHAYEKLSDLDRSRNPIPKLMMDSAVRSLGAMGIALDHPLANLTPELLITPFERNLALEQLSTLKKPWIAVVPRSNSWPCRTVSVESWRKFSGYFHGVTAPVWTGTDPSPEGFVDLKHRSLRMMAAMFQHCDMVVSVDTGPVHLAAAVGTPIVHVTQSVAGIMTLPDQRDWVDYRMPLDCLACHAWKCPKNESHPPCQDLPGDDLAAFVDSRLNLRSKDGVAGVLVTYKPDIGRINKAIDLVLPQVQELIVALDGDTSRQGIRTNQKIKFVQHYSKERRGFGKTFNLGARHSAYRYLLSINDDVFVDDNCVSAMLETLQQNTRAAVVGSLLRYPDGRIQHGGTRRGHDGYGHLDHLGNKPSISTATEMECVTFALAMFRRQAFYDILGFDERYDCYSEDPDFCLRARQRGWSVMYQPAATAVHIEGQTTVKLNRPKLLSDGHRIFKTLWDWYFHLNRNNTGLGRFA